MWSFSDFIHPFQNLWHAWKHCLKLFSEGPFSTVVTFPWISSNVSKWDNFEENYLFHNMNKSYGDKAGKYGGLFNYDICLLSAMTPLKLLNMHNGNAQSISTKDMVFWTHVLPQNVPKFGRLKVLRWLFWRNSLLTINSFDSKNCRPAYTF